MSVFVRDSRSGVRGRRGWLSGKNEDEGYAVVSPFFGVMRLITLN